MTQGVTQNTSDLPTFDRPPVSEVIIAVEFTPLAGVGPFELMELHGSWESDFPNRQIHPAIPPAMLSGMDLQLSSTLPPLRLWSQTKAGDVLIQAQADRVVLNWRRVESDEEQAYPSYRSLILRWENVWNQFCSRLEGWGISPPRPSIAEVSYVNEIELSDSAEAFAEFTFFPRAFTDGPVQQASSRIAIATETAVGSGHTTVQADLLTDGSAKLTSSIVTRLSLLPEDPNFRLRNALDQAHVASVGTFARSASERMKEKWGLK